MKIYELTTNGLGGWRKFWIVGCDNDSTAKSLAKKVFGKFYWENGVSFYDRTEDAKARGRGKYWMTKSEFLKLKKRYNY